VERLSLYLYEHNVIALREPLYKQSAPNSQSASIGVQNSTGSGAQNAAASGAKKKTITFRGHPNMSNCVASLTENCLYESAMPTWKLNPVGGNPPKLHNWWQYFARRATWSEAKSGIPFKKEDQRHYSSPRFVPTYLETLAKVDPLIGKGESFKDLQLAAFMY
jgi:hypothetical protein